MHLGIYTKKGDSLETSLPYETGVKKDDPRIHFIGEIDELNCYLGLLKNLDCSSNIKNHIEQIQKNLTTVMVSAIGMELSLSDLDIADIEREIDFLYGFVEKKNEFIIPGEGKVSAVIDICRAVARRAERSLATVCINSSVDENTKKYLNRLSDYLFVAARYTKE